jgi:Ran GTPase-activating protein (RanGAP) involved in mRNA processing and transport
MTKLDMSDNDFKGAAAGNAIGDMLSGNSTLKDLDLSGCRIDSDAAQGISKGVAGNGAMASLNLSSNNLVINKWRAKDNDNRSPWVHLDGRTQRGKRPIDLDVSGIVAIANAIKDMGALTSLDLSSNNLKDEGGKIVAEAIKVTDNAMAVVWHHFYAHLITG